MVSLHIRERWSSLRDMWKHGAVSATASQVEPGLDTNNYRVYETKVEPNRIRLPP
jgi:hypothetical protein